MKAKVERSIKNMLPGQFAIVKFKKEYLKSNRSPTLEDVRCFFRVLNSASEISDSMDLSEKELKYERLGFLTMYHNRTTKFLSVEEIMLEIKEEDEELDAILHSYNPEQPQKPQPAEGYLGGERS